METITALNIDRSGNFDISDVVFDGYGCGMFDFWSIGYQDERSSLLSSLSSFSLGLVPCVEYQDCLNNGKTHLDIKVLEVLWCNKDIIPEDWKNLSENEEIYIFFDGTILLDPDGIPMIACISWNGSGWDLWFDWVGAKRGPESFSAVYQGNL